VPAEGFEPPTYGLQNRCTTTVLSRQSNDLRRSGGYDRAASARILLARGERDDPNRETRADDVSMAGSANSAGQGRADRRQRLSQRSSQ
jgi:hypothetical protein